MLSINELTERIATTERQMEQLDREIEPMRVKLSLMREERLRLFQIWTRATNQLKLAKSKAATPDYKTHRLFEGIEPEDKGAPAASTPPGGA